MKAIVRAAGEGDVMQVMAMRVEIRVRSTETGGAFSVVEMHAPPAFQAPPIPHRHLDVDWYGFVEEGEVAIELDGQLHRVPQGGIATVPRGVAFRWWNASDARPVRWLCTYTPGGFEDFFREMFEGVRSLGHAPAPAEMAAIA
ncbi:MAG TPA: cupin domain-containing protein [Thermoanaerobaculia bacterium]|nr:cupin domain-containing protein [Thermoanaerobaculia bacterium]